MASDDLRDQSRKHLDGRRVGAVLIDGALFAPIELVAWQYDTGAAVLATALALIYFYLCDVMTGQTLGKSLLGLRTVSVDGGLVSPKAAGSRTVLRIIDHTLLGLIVMVATGGRRQRIGDLLAKTVVRASDVVVTPRPFGRELLVRPALWLAPALVVFFLSAEGKLSGSYRAQADAVCAEANALMRQAQTPVDAAVVLAHLSDQLAALEAPANWQPRHDALVTEAQTLSAELTTLVERARRAKRPERVLRRGWARMEAQIPQANARIAALGFEDCAES